jgi:4-hydroxyacetophenone monooxygenase
MVEKNIDELDCRQEVHDEYNVRVDDIHGKMVWAHPGMSSWYKNSRGRVVMTTPWRMVDYWRLTEGCNLEDYSLRSIKDRSPT